MEEVKVDHNSNRLKFTRGTHLLARGFTSENVACRGQRFLRRINADLLGYKFP